MLNVDNTGAAQTGKTHVGVVLQHANLWGLDHVASLQYTSSLEKPDKVGVYGAGYHLPLYALGDRCISSPAIRTSIRAASRPAF
jgi:hemolysin activation/secretion protein